MKIELQNYGLKFQFCQTSIRYRVWIVGTFFFKLETLDFHQQEGEVAGKSGSGQCGNFFEAL